MAHSFADLLVHVVFSTKRREPLLTPDIRPRLLAYMGGIIGGLDCVPVLINGPVDHEHALVALSTKTALANLLRELKGDSTAWVHATFPAHRGFAWQTGYAAFSVSESMRERVRAYIARQEEHHRRATFQEEYVRLLKKHGVAYDPRFVFH